MALTHLTGGQLTHLPQVMVTLDEHWSQTHTMLAEEERWADGPPRSMGGFERRLSAFNVNYDTAVHFSAWKNSGIQAAVLFIIQINNLRGKSVRYCQVCHCLFYTERCNCWEEFEMQMQDFQEIKTCANILCYFFLHIGVILPPESTISLYQDCELNKVSRRNAFSSPQAPAWCHICQG